MGAGTASKVMESTGSIPLLRLLSVPVCASITAHGATRRLEDCSCVGETLSRTNKRRYECADRSSTWKRRHILGVALTQADVARMKCSGSRAAQGPTVPEHMSDPSLWKVGMGVEDEKNLLPITAGSLQRRAAGSNTQPERRRKTHNRQTHAKGSRTN